MAPLAPQHRSCGTDGTNGPCAPALSPPRTRRSRVALLALYFYLGLVSVLYQSQSLMARGSACLLPRILRSSFTEPGKTSTFSNTQKPSNVWTKFCARSKSESCKTILGALLSFFNKTLPYSNFQILSLREKHHNIPKLTIYLNLSPYNCHVKKCN